MQAISKIMFATSSIGPELLALCHSASKCHTSDPAESQWRMVLTNLSMWYSVCLYWRLQQVLWWPSAQWYNYFSFYVCECLPIWIHVHHLHTWYPQKPQEIVENPHVGAGHWILGLCKSSQPVLLTESHTVYSWVVLASKGPCHLHRDYFSFSIPNHSEELPLSGHFFPAKEKRF